MLAAAPTRGAVTASSFRDRIPLLVEYISGDELGSRSMNLRPHPANPSTRAPYRMLRYGYILRVERSLTQPD